MFSALFQRPRFFFVVFCAPQKQGFLRSTNELNEEGKDASHKTHGLFSFFVVFFFLFSVCRKRFILPDDLFLKEEKNLIKHRTLFLFLSHTSSNQTSARKARKKKTVLALRRPFCRRLIKKTSPIIRVKSPTTNRRPQRERTRRQQTTTTTTTDDDALWRKERRHFWTTTTTTTTGQQK